MTQPIHLITKEIIGYLCQIEQKAPRKQFALYETKHKMQPNTALSLATVNDEAKSMLEFVGLHDHQPDIRFEVLDGNVGGNISLNNTMEPVVHICISSTFRNNWSAILAVLAHEICHKFLMVNGLYCAIDVNVNETFVDLATMYVGFGELILNGYNTKVGNVNYQLGYLTIDTYKVAYHLVCSVLGNLSSYHGEGVDAIADEAVRRWNTNGDKYELLKQGFVNKSQQLSELSRNLSAMEQLIIQCKEKLSSNYNALDMEFFHSLREKDGDYVDKMAAFYTFYKSMFDSKGYDVTHELNDIISEALYKVYMVCQRQGHIELRSEKVTCPSCGTVGKTVKTESGIVKCPKCYRIFYWNANQWNCTCYQRQIEGHRREERLRFEQKVQEEVEKRVHDLHEKADAKMEHFKKNEMAICKAAIRSSMPRFYRWLVSDYLE